MHTTASTGLLSIFSAELSDLTGGEWGRMLRVSLFFSIMLCVFIDRQLCPFRDTSVEREIELKFNLIDFYRHNPESQRYMAASFLWLLGWVFFSSPKMAETQTSTEIICQQSSTFSPQSSSQIIERGREDGENEDPEPLRSCCGLIAPFKRLVFSWHSSSTEREKLQWLSSLELSRWEGGGGGGKQWGPLSKRKPTSIQLRGSLRSRKCCR